MFNIGSGEIALIAIAALLLLGPKGLPELARGIGKFMREFRRQTDSVRNIVEREFYAMDQDIHPDPIIAPPADSVAQALDPGHDANGALLPDALPPVTEEVRSQVTAGAPGALAVDTTPAEEHSSVQPAHVAEAAAVQPEPPSAEAPPAATPGVSAPDVTASPGKA